MPTVIHTTMLAIVQAVSEHAANDTEVVATVASLINSGKVVFCGNFAGARIDLSIPPHTQKEKRDEETIRARRPRIESRRIINE